MTPGDVDLFEIDEAFTAVAIESMRDLDIGPPRSTSTAEPGERQLLAGLRGALELRRLIDWAVAYLADLHQVDPDEAFEVLRAGEHSGGSDIARTARRLLIS